MLIVSRFERYAPATSYPEATSRRYASPSMVGSICQAASIAEWRQVLQTAGSVVHIVPVYPGLSHSGGHLVRPCSTALHWSIQTEPALFLSRQHLPIS